MLWMTGFRLTRTVREQLVGKEIKTHEERRVGQGPHPRDHPASDLLHHESRFCRGSFMSVVKLRSFNSSAICADQFFQVGIVTIRL
jgi:hypothetical protein